jgi:hypothetical protein
MRYEIRVDGRVDPSALSDFATVTAAVQPLGTVLACDVADAAALTGMIAMLANRGIVVHDIHEVVCGPPESPSPATDGRRSAESVDGAD